jgi:serine/threonine protein kinase
LCKNDPVITPGSTLDGRYEIQGLLASGGMGEVYRARRVLLGDEVVIKAIRTGGREAADLRDRFLRESRLCAQLRHPNIVTILDFAIAPDGEPYLVMEYLNGPSLRDELATHGPMTPVEVRQIIEPICGALQLAHDRQIVHRDLKPANIVSHRFETGDIVYKVIDFGLANMREGADTRLTGAGEYMGTVAYSSPEQLQAENIDARTDVYSLGVVVFEMLTGRPPFEAATPLGVITKHLCDPPPNLSDMVPQVPATLARTVGKALAKDPADRWPSMLDFARAIASIDEDGSKVPDLSGLHGKYEIGPVVAAGRLGSQVHLGRHRALGAPMAIRVLRRGQRQDWDAVRARFLSEARALQVSHPSVIQVRDFGEEHDTLYLVTDFIEGPSLLQLLDRDAPLEWSRVQALGMQLIEATVAVQRKGGLVCGVNPGIIRMTRDEDGERLMVSTGGIGQVRELLASMSEAMLRGGELHATEMPYIAPEVLTGKAADQRSDVFTLGVLLYEMATGILPFAGRTLPELLGKMLGGDPRDPRELQAGVSEAGAACLLRCLQKDPAARVGTPADLRQLWQTC